jgi:hypothetical protein
MAKFYFREDNEEDGAYLKKQIIEDMKEEGIAELKIFEAQRMTGIGYFYCTELMEVAEVGEGCGKFCKDYKPRNGKNGRCRFSGFCYEPIDKFEIIRLKS